MANRWFRIPETGDGTMGNAYRPDHVDAMGLSYSGNEPHPDGPPVWVVRVRGTTSELDTLAGKLGVTEYDSVPVTVLDQMFDQDRTASAWADAFRVT